ncbi:MAG: hypothetical protein A2Z27_02330 [candidate division Zixibacteria bacterium RBG_16_50_21]|nr:MAG: hypothetical protein A2Z27_02330 [candidate division Zixibacteria bacterium RBG_16_50_21]
MPEKLLRFSFKFLAVSAPLALLWFWKLQGYYEKLFIAVVGFLSVIFRTNLHLPIPAAFFHNLIPFTSLILISAPKLKVRVIWLLLVGWLILLAEHLFLSLILFLLLNLWKVGDSLYNWLFTPLSVVSGAFPFFLWILLMRMEISQLFLPKPYSSSPR